jgi:Phosphotransferase enzyme family
MSTDPGVALGPSAPRDLIDALERRRGSVIEAHRRGRREYAIADSADGRLFVHLSADRGDAAAFAHEAAVRNRVGAGGALRSPEILDRGEGWLLARCVDTLPFGGPACVALAVQAVADLMLLDLPSMEARSRPVRTLARRWRALRSPLPVGDIRAAKGVLARSSLPAVASHGDLVPENLLFDGGALWLVDWELSGQRPAGFDLMQLWATSKEGEDRERLLEGANEITGARYRPQLLELRYAVVVAEISNLFAAPSSFDRDPEHGRVLLELLPRLRSEAGLTR